MIPSLVERFVERARRRFLWNEAIAQSAFAAAVLFAGVILLLLVGTQLLDWRWVAAFTIAGAAFGLYRTLTRVPNRYQVAVTVDHRAGLHDALSTALHFTAGGARSPGLPAIREFQRQQTERLIPLIDLDRAVPFRIPRALYVMGLLGLVASSLFALRYGIRRTLNFDAPLTRVVMDGLGLHAPEDKLASAQKKSGDGKQSDTLDEQGLPFPKSEQKRAGELDAASPSALETVGDPDVNNEKAESASAGKDSKEKGEGAGKEGGDKGSPEQAENGQQAGAKNADSPAGSKEGAPQGEPGASQQSSQGNNSSLLSKMKEAMQNLLSKAKPQKGDNGQKPNGAQGQQKGQSQQAKSGEKGSPGESKDGGQQDQAQGEGQQAGDQDNSDSSQGKGNGKSSEQQAAAQPGSGVGKQDGAKDIRAAEQKAAMGKLTEVIGKRSAQVSGEMMIESQSGPQQLRTQYSKRAATHTQAAGEVNRDEVPVELQGYVQQYFAEVRKAEHSGVKARAAVGKSAAGQTPGGSPGITEPK